MTDAPTPIVVVGIGADGWEGLAPTSRAEVERAEVLLGSRRQLELLPDSVTAERVPWPSPLSEALLTRAGALGLPRQQVYRLALGMKDE